jgi:ADP-ribose pyrophosphatase YjhB (NUDIX family)
MPTLKYKVLAYITHGDRLLVFSHPYAPEAGIQVPGGTKREGESPEEAIMREAREETGLKNLQLQAFLGEFDQQVPELAEIWRRRVYHLTCEAEPPTRWRHQEMHPSDGSPGPITFEFFWVKLPDEVPALAPGHEAMVPKLLELLSLEA